MSRLIVTCLSVDSPEPQAWLRLVSSEVQAPSMAGARGRHKDEMTVKQHRPFESHLGTVSTGR